MKSVRSKAPLKWEQIIVIGLGFNKTKVPYNVFTDQPSEIVIGLVGPLGTNTKKVRAMIASRLDVYGYEVKIVGISSTIIPALAQAPGLSGISAYEHAKSLIAAGNLIRKESENNAVLAIAAAAEIARQRPSPSSSVTKICYIISSLKLPEEVAELRKIYGKGFHLMAIYADREDRVNNLHEGGRGMKVDEAWELITQDENEVEDYGQHTRDTFHLADCFVADEKNDDKLRYSVERWLDLVFGNIFITPTFNEFCMFMAFSASLRSADLSRQVGAVIAKGNEILSTGANDCPAPGGGLYWPHFIGDRIDDLPRGRDFKRDGDSNVLERNKLIAGIVSQLPKELQAEAQAIIKSSPLKDLTEYGRVVHAEMEAIIACARSNVSCRAASLYCTTFPCHNCAKHIVAAGIEQVVYVEPYPKSKALSFHDDSITTEKLGAGESKVRFKPFIGVGPRQFFELFSLSLSSGRKIRRKADDGTIFEWQARGALPRVQMLPVSYRRFEEGAIEYIKYLTGG